MPKDPFHPAGRMRVVSQVAASAVVQSHEHLRRTSGDVALAGENYAEILTESIDPRRLAACGLGLAACLCSCRYALAKAVGTFSWFPAAYGMFARRESSIKRSPTEYG